MRPNVLVIDDEVEVGRFLDVFLREEKGYRVTVANSGGEARQALQAGPFDLALVDLQLPDANGIDLLKEIRESFPRCQVIIMTGYSTVKSAVEAVKLGAYDYVDKPFEELDRLEETIDQALAAHPGSRPGPGETVRLAARHSIVMGEASPMARVLEVARKIAGKSITVLLHGPTGTGKECVARFIHANSRRAERPFVGVNCGAFAETLLASELFGHEKGAFTGAAHQHRGIFELADGGTLFLDEIGEATPGIQVKLLKVLEAGEFMRVGGERPLRTDVRLIAATNIDLAEAVQAGAFRKDLFYRLDVVPLRLPPLRERPGDIDALLRHFIDRLLPEGEKGRVSVSPAVRRALLHYDWPGNVRELSNVVAGMMALREGPVLEPDLLPAKVVGARGPGSGPTGAAVPPWGGEDLEATAVRWGEELFEQVLADGDGGGLPRVLETLKEFENRVATAVIRKALERTGGTRAAAARLLRANPRVLRYYLNERRR